MITISRAPFQVLVLPYTMSDTGTIRYAIFQRSDLSEPCWQGIAGGGDAGEKPEEAARREAFEEGGVCFDAPLMQLDSMATIPVHNFGGFIWGPSCYVIPEYTFGVELSSEHVIISSEHSSSRWETFEVAYDLLRWDSNKNALWELNQRLKTGHV